MIVPYDYSHRKGVQEITWDEFSTLARQLAEKLEPYHLQAVVGIASPGLFPTIAVALALRTSPAV